MIYLVCKLSKELTFTQFPGYSASQGRRPCFIALPGPGFVCLSFAKARRGSTAPGVA